jgi:hypothetical protein
MMYLVNNILIRMTYIQIQKENDQKRFKNVDFKLISNEFRHLNLLSDVLHALRLQMEFKIRVPLACLVEYRGFKCLCLALPPIKQQESMVHGLVKN